jgi:hypothetical protein
LPFWQIHIEQDLPFWQIHIEQDLPFWKIHAEQENTKDIKNMQKMYGGNPMVIASLDELENPNNYSQIYVGIGIKWHSFEYEDSFFIGTSQLLPSFLNKEGRKSLILLIDTFTKDELSETQSKITELNDSKYNFDFRIINSQFDESLKTHLCSYLKRKPSVSPENLWICNFVKFYNSPNTSEQTNRDSVGELFNEIARDLQITDCVYEWITQTEFLIKHKFKIKLQTTVISKIVMTKEWVLKFV